MASSAPKVILLKGSPIQKEAIAGEANIRPGMLLEMTSEGKVVSHNSASDTKGPLRIAREAEYIGGSIDDLYDDGDTVPYYVAKAGDEYYALLQAGEDVAIGAKLQSAADGTLEAQTSTNPTVAIAREAVDNNPGTGGAAVRIKVEAV